MTSPQTDAFFDQLPLFTAFEDVADDSHYTALPEGWQLALADVVDSTGAVADGRYKSVNMAGASVIAAVINTLGRSDIPFVFGGDGALVAIPPSAIDQTREALAAVATWVKEALDLTLRVALVPVEDVRAAGVDVRVARFGASEAVAYAMFSGGGAAWAEAQMKGGRYAIPPAPPLSRPDMTGLSCRWSPIPARNGQIVSIIAVPVASAAPSLFAALVADIVALAGTSGRGGHPVPENGPNISLSPDNLRREVRATSDQAHHVRRAFRVAAEMLLGWLLGVFGFRIGSFDMRAYRRDLVRNTDFRKFDDGLKMTVDVTMAVADRIEARLRQAQAAGVIRYGLHRQDEALMTCVVPSLLSKSHMHFVDGAAGGYAVAAGQLKAALASPPVL